MQKFMLMLILALWCVGACGGAAEPPPTRPLAGVAVLRVGAEEFRKLRGQWRGTEVGDSLEWTFSFGDAWAVVVGNAAGEWYEGQAGLHFELGVGGDGIIRVPPGSGMIDVDVWTSRRAVYDGEVSLGVYYFTQPTELKLCASEPGVHMRALSYDTSTPLNRCFRLKKIADEPAAGRLAPVEKENAPVERQK